MCRLPCFSLAVQDLGGCGVKNPVVHRLAHLPRVFTLQLAWRSNREEPASIAATLRTLDEQVGRVAGGACTCVSACCLACTRTPMPC